MRETSLIVSDIDFILLMTMQPPPGLRAELERAFVVPPRSMPAGIVGMGSCVRYIDHRNGNRHEIKIVYPGEEDVSLGRVSILSPIGTALLGRIEGQTIGGATPFTVVAVTPPDSRRRPAMPDGASTDLEADEEQVATL